MSCFKKLLCISLGLICLFALACGILVGAFFLALRFLEHGPGIFFIAMGLILLIFTIPLFFLIHFLDKKQKMWLEEED